MFRKLLQHSEGPDVPTEITPEGVEEVPPFYPCSTWSSRSSQPAEKNKYKNLWCQQFYATNEEPWWWNCRNWHPDQCHMTKIVASPSTHLPTGIPTVHGCPCPAVSRPAQILYCLQISKNCGSSIVVQKTFPMVISKWRRNQWTINLWWVPKQRQ